jgi:hypothetical protein
MSTIVIFVIRLQTVIIVTMVIAFISAVLISLIVSNLSSITVIPSSPTNKIVEDARDDSTLVNLDRTNIIPEIKDYHDILSANVKKVNDHKLLLSIELAGDANRNEKYETVYIWVIYYRNSVSGKDQYYSVIIPNFAIDSKFEAVGWNLAIFNNTGNSYTLPLSEISAMPKNKVEVFIDPNFVGNPLSFNYMVSTMIRVNNTFLDKPPDYIVDSAPDNDLFWLKWFA